MMNMYPEAWESDQELSFKDCSATEDMKESLYYQNSKLYAEY